MSWSGATNDKTLTSQSLSGRCDFMCRSVKFILGLSNGLTLGSAAYIDSSSIRMRVSFLGGSATCLRLVKSVCLGHQDVPVMMSYIQARVTVLDFNLGM